MKKSIIHFDIILDEKSIPESIVWDASDKPGDPEHTKSISVAVWDDKEKNAMCLDLWTKEMPVLEMKKFYLDTMAGMAQSLLTATGDQTMSSAINSLCEELGDKLQNEVKNQS